jgi:hypothetical protein
MWWWVHGRTFNFRCSYHNFFAGKNLHLCAAKNHKKIRLMELTLDLNRQYTYADYLTWMDNKRRELVNGFIKLMSAVSTAHSSVSMSIATDLKGYIRQHKGGCKVFCAPFDVRLPRNGERENNKIHTVVQPDGKYDSGTVYEYDVEAVPVHIFEGLQLQWKDIFEV